MQFVSRRNKQNTYQQTSVLKITTFNLFIAKIHVLFQILLSIMKTTSTFNIPNCKHSVPYIKACSNERLIGISSSSKMNQFKAFLFVIPLLVAAAKSAEDFTEANNKFAPDVYKQISETQTGNIIVSPLSAELVLTLLEFGCKEATAEELRTALYLPNNKTKIESGVESLLSKTGCTQSLILDLANKIYIQENFSIKESFEKIAVDVFNAKSENINFANSEQAVNTINQWVEDQTNHTIKNLIDPGVLDASTKVVLVNALHFRGNWSIPFSTTDTRKADFYKTSTDVIQVDTLYLQGKSFNYYESESAQFLELNFKGGASMIFILPTQRDGLSELEKKIDLSSSIPFKSILLNVAIPKFKYETKIDFKKILEKLNVTKIFNAGEADLSGIAGQKGELVVSAVAQKAFIDLNEGGVEASAATYVAINRQSAVIGEDRTKSFIADHPFIFIIKFENVILFIGRVTEPKY